MERKTFEKSASLLLLTILLAFSSISCRKSLQTYSGDAGIYFAMSVKSTSQNSDTLYSDTTLLPFAATSAQDSTLRIKVKILGEVSKQDRYFTIRTIPEETNLLPEDAQLPPQENILPAGEVFGSLSINFHRSPSLKGNERKLCIELVENADFKLPIQQWRNGSSEYVDVVRHTIIISDKFVQLPGYSEYYFGPFSEKKMKLILEISGKKLSDFNEKLPHVYAKALGQNLDRYLQQQKAKGNPVLEEDGTPMTSGKGIYN